MNLYGLLIVAGIIASLLVAQRLKPQSIKNIDLFNILPYILLSAVIGARFYHVIDFFSYYFQNPLQILYVWQGGLGILGAILGGIVGLFIYARKEKLNGKQRVALLNLASLVMPLGQAVGRLGNYFNQELYGKPTQLPWGIYINPENRVMKFNKFSHFHPLFFYESLFNLIVFVFFIWILKYKKTKISSGIYFYLYLLFYSFARFMLDFLRVRNWEISLPWFGMAAVSQVISVGLIIFSLTQIVRIVDRNLPILNVFAKK